MTNRDCRTSRREYDAVMFAYQSPIDEKLIQQDLYKKQRKRSPKNIK